MLDLVDCPGDDISLPELLQFALTYNGYQRLGDHPTHLHRVVRPVLAAIEKGERPPTWAGLDLLRGALFYIQRMTHHWGDVPPEQEAQMRALLRAIREATHGRPLTVDELP